MDIAEKEMLKRNEEVVETPAEEAPAEVVETPDTPHHNHVVVVETNLDSIVEDEFYLGEVKEDPFSEVSVEEYYFETLNLVVTLKGGKKLVGSFECSRDLSEDFLILKNDGRVVILPMDSELMERADLEDYPSAVIDFLVKAREDFRLAPTAPYGAERVCKVLLVCQDAHGHANPLDGLVQSCKSYCPVNQVWLGKCREVQHG